MEVCRMNREAWDYQGTKEVLEDGDNKTDAIEGLEIQEANLRVEEGQKMKADIQDGGRNVMKIEKPSKLMSLYLLGNFNRVFYL